MRSTSTTLFLVIAFPFTVAVLAGFVSADEPISISAKDWPGWRGPYGNGIASADQQPPLQWSASRNVRWSAPIPGRGHASPTVLGDRVYLPTADHKADRQSVFCFHRDSGKLIWSVDVHRGGLETKGNKKASQASSTIATDGHRLYVNFLNKGVVYTTALSLDGQQLWQTEISRYVVHQGYGSSPAIYGPLVIVSADNKGGGAIAALERKTGRLAWRHDRPSTPNYASPVIFNIGGRDQLFFQGCDLVSSFDPLSGRKLWEIEGATTECVTTTVTDGTHIYSSGGYPRNHVAAIRADGSGKIAWENNTRVYVPSMLAQDGYLYAVADAGVAICWEAATGKEMWKQRLGGVFSASPVIVGPHVFAANEGGKTFIFKAQPSGFEAVGENQLGNDVYATQTICGSRIYARVGFVEDEQRYERLYCLANEE